jgi:hypothetical protein
VRSENAEAVGDAGVAAAPDAVKIRSQLANLLGSGHFRNSKRSQSLLRFVVEASVDGRQDELKERTIGVSVFGREASYDTAQDAIVRNAAIEVRKRLAQYYLEPEHRGELRIDLPLGAYCPTFAPETEASPAPPPRVVSAAPSPQVNHRKLILLLAILAVAGIAAAAFLTTGRTAASELDAFWQPLFRNHQVIQVSVGQPGKLYRFTGTRSAELDRMIQSHATPETPILPAEMEWAAPDFLYMRDAFAAARIAAWIQSKSGRYQLLSVSRTTYTQLRRNPVVAIGAFDNPWGLRVTSDLRFVFDHKTIDGVVYNCVTDRRNPNATGWMVARSVGTRTNQDYAIVTRVFDPSTEHTVVSVAGIESYGTLAAGEFVTEPQYLGEALLHASKDWRRKNVQIVLGTKIIEGTPGPPMVLATHYW